MYLVLKMKQVFNIKAKNISINDQIEYIKKYRESGDNKYKELIILANIKLISKFIDKYCTDDSYRDDCFSVCLLAVNRAIDMYNIDNEYKATFTTYLSTAIRNALWRFLNKETKYIADVSLDEPITYNDYGDPMYLIDIIAVEEDDELEYLEGLDKVLNFMNTYFSERTLKLFYYKFGLNNYPKLMEKEIGQILNMSRSNVGNYYAKGLRAIRSYINKGKKPRRRV